MEQITLLEFLHAVFKNDLPNTYICNDTYKHLSLTKKIPLNQPLYYAICSVSNNTRKNDNFQSLNVIVCDDVGTKTPVPALPPSYIIETSPDNFQYGYVLTDAERDPTMAKELISALIKSGYTDPGAHGIVRLVRLPAGINGKDEPSKKDFRVRLTHWSPTTTYMYDVLYTYLKSAATTTGNKTKKSKEDGYEIPDAIKDGTRNIELTRLCGYLFSQGHSQEAVTIMMLRYNDTLCDTPVELDELDSIITSIAARHVGKYDAILNDIYHIRATNTWFDFSDMTEMSADALNISNIVEFPGTKDSKAKLATWLPKQDGFNQVADYTWYPVPYHKQQRTITQDGRRLLNTWRGFAIEPGEGDVQPWLDHLEHVVPEEDYRRALLWWIAYTVQHPDKRINWQPIILGASGAGKDGLFRPVASILGSAYKIIGNKDIQGDYDDGLYQTKLLHISEANGLRGHAIDFYKRITAAEASSMQMLNIKCKGKVMQHNLCSVLVITNNLDAMKFTKDERRAYVLRSPTPMSEEQQRLYFDEWLDKDGAAYLFDYLLRYDLSEYKPGVRPYRTTHFEALINLTQSDSEIRLDELLEPYDAALPEYLRIILGNDGDKYAITKIKVWLESNGWVLWHGGDGGRRIKRKINGEICPPKSRDWYVKKKGKFFGSSPADMCREVERIEAIMLKQTKF